MREKEGEVDKFVNGIRKLSSFLHRLVKKERRVGGRRRDASIYQRTT